jgi:hypothetical protein
VQLEPKRFQFPQGAPEGRIHLTFIPSALPVIEAALASIGNLPPRYLQGCQSLSILSSRIPETSSDTLTRRIFFQMIITKMISQMAHRKAIRHYISITCTYILGIRFTIHESDGHGLYLHDSRKRLSCSIVTTGRELKNLLSLCSQDNLRGNTLKFQRIRTYLCIRTSPKHHWSNRFLLLLSCPSNAARSTVD